MSVGVKVGSIVTEVGASTFLNAFFSTVTALLESDRRGSRFPVIAGDLYEGHVGTDKVRDGIAELKSIQSELTNHPPSAIVWDLDDRSQRPPWGDNIAPRITSMSNYFVSSAGRDLFELLFEVFGFALETKRSVDVVEI